MVTEISHFLPETARLRQVVMSDDDFTPRLGSQRGKDGKKVVKYGDASALLHASRARRPESARDGSTAVGSGAAPAWGGCFRAATGSRAFAGAVPW